MSLNSEYNTKPSAVLVCHPSNLQALTQLQQRDLEKLNFQSIPDYGTLLSEYDSFIDAIKSFDIEVIDIFNLLDSDSAVITANNPNVMFMRDSTITLPWAPNVVITAQMTLNGRSSEPKIITNVLKKFGIDTILESPFRLEGGDVIPVVIDGKRTLFVGVGMRTTKSATKWLYDKLVPNYADEIIYFEHKNQFLHLDTSLVFLPNQTVLCAESALGNQGSLNRHGTAQLDSSITEYLKNYSYKIVEAGSINAIKNEVCNLLPVGDDTYIGFNIDQITTEEINELSGAKIVSIDSTAITSANGGAHCLTRPLYNKYY